MAKREATPETAPVTASQAAVELAHVGVLGGAKAWVVHEGLWWLCSFVFHLGLVCSLALVGGKVVQKVVDEAPSFEEANVPQSVEVPQQIERFEVSQTPEDSHRVEQRNAGAGKAGRDDAGGEALRR